SSRPDHLSARPAARSRTAGRATDIRATIGEQVEIGGRNHRRRTGPGCRISQLRAASRLEPRTRRLRHEPQGRPGPSAGRGAASGHRGVHPRARQGAAPVARREREGPLAAAVGPVRRVRHPVRGVRIVRADPFREGAVLGLATLGLMVALGSVATHAEPRVPQRTHEVRPGDTLHALAKKYGTTVAAIVAANNLAGPGVIKVGQRLIIPSGDAALAKGGVPPSSPAVGPAVGSARAPTRLVLAVPDFDNAIVAFTWPVEGPVVSTFGQRRSGWHGGIDIKAPLGTPVWAAAGGVVIASGMEADYGLVV